MTPSQTTAVASRFGAQKMAPDPRHDSKALLRNAGLRPTRQRMTLWSILRDKGGWHWTAEALYEEAGRAKARVSLATVYNTLHQFTEAGLLRQIVVESSKTFFDTNVSSHHHFFVEGDNTLFDVPDAAGSPGALPPLPDGYELARIDVVVRLRRIAAA